MSDMKCPFCRQKLEPIGTSGQFQCGTWGCDASFNFIATRDVWEYIDRTRKALEIAVDTLKLLNSEGKRTRILGLISITDTALDKITALDKGGDNDR